MAKTHSGCILHLCGSFNVHHAFLFVFVLPHLCGKQRATPAVSAGEGSEDSRGWPGRPLPAAASSVSFPPDGRQGFGTVSALKWEEKVERIFVLFFFQTHMALDARC